MKVWIGFNLLFEFQAKLRPCNARSRWELPFRADAIENGRNHVELWRFDMFDLLFGFQATLIAYNDRSRWKLSFRADVIGNWHNQVEVWRFELFWLVVWISSNTNTSQCQISLRTFTPCWFHWKRTQPRRAMKVWQVWLFVSIPSNPDTLQWQISLRAFVPCWFHWKRTPPRRSLKVWIVFNLMLEFKEMLRPYNDRSRL